MTRRYVRFGNGITRHAEGWLGEVVTQPGSAPGPFMPPRCLSRQAQPTLLGGSGLRLRPWFCSDAPALVRAYEDPDIYRWHCRSLSFADAESWVSHERERWKQDSGCSWAITQNGSLCGRVGIRRCPPR